MSRPQHLPPIPRRRVAGAPISWGVCEVPGWGYQMPPERVLTEMAALGLPATEAGPDGYLPADHDALGALLAAHGLALAGGFVPVELHRDEAWGEPVRAAAARLAAAGGEVLVLAAATGAEGYDAPPALDAPAWRRLLANVDAAAAVAAEHGLLAVLHPHLGTYVEGADDVERVLDGAAVALCIDTGHLLAAGVDPVALCQQVPERVAHVHLKDVDAAMAGEVARGRGYHDAVRAGLYRPLGAGDVDIAGLLDALEGSGYRGWYVLEQDLVLDDEPPAGGGPAAQARASLQCLLGSGGADGLAGSGLVRTPRERTEG